MAISDIPRLAFILSQGYNHKLTTASTHVDIDVRAILLYRGFAMFDCRTFLTGSPDDYFNQDQPNFSVLGGSTDT